MLPKKRIFINGMHVTAKYEDAPDIPEAVDQELDNLMQSEICWAIERWGNTYTNITNPYFTSHAQCMAEDEDEYDVNIGIDIASEKCDAKYHDAVADRCNYYIKELNKTIATLEKIRDKHGKKVVNICTDILKIGGSCDEGN